MSQSDPLANIHEKLKDPTKPFSLLVSFTLKPGKAAAFQPFAEEAVRATRLEPGNIAYEFHQSTSTTDWVFLFEKWRSLDDLLHHLQLPHTEKVIAAMGEHAASPIQVNVNEFYAV
jgi:quinol monooxygenase YgiN